MIEAKQESPELLKRLINWNVEVLLKLLKEVVAKREASGRGGWDEDPEILTKTTIIDEVVDVIKLPGLSAASHVSPKSIEIPTQVEQQLREFVTAIANAYRSNPFNCLQKASQSTVSATKLMSRVAYAETAGDDDDHMSTLLAHIHRQTYGIASDPLTRFAVSLAAFICAVDHRGVDNQTLVMQDPDIARQFGEHAATQQLSLMKAWKKLMAPDFENLRRCIYADKEEKMRFRQVMVNAVMSTDQDDVEAQARRQERWDRSFGPGADIDEDSSCKATCIIECLMQASINFHVMQHWHVYIKWNERAFEEGNKAYKAGLIPNDPAKTWYKDELNRFDNFVIPLTMQMKDIDAFVVSSDEYLNYALKNRQRWASNGREIVAALVAKHTTGSASAKVDLIKAISKEGKDEETSARDVAASKHLQRLVDWNYEVLSRLLKQIIAKREVYGEAGSGADTQVLKPKEGETAIDEVVEVIDFPAFDAASSYNHLDPATVQLSAPVAMQLREYVSHVSTHYGNHTYHCLDHASYVSMNAKKFLGRILGAVSTGEPEEAHKQTFGLISDPLAQFAVVFAALIHDMAHTGKSNSQLIEENDELAAKYKNRCITEQHSIELAWGQLMQPEFEDLRAAICSDERDLKRFRQIVVKSVVATDFTDKQLVERRNIRWEKAFGSEQDNTNLKATIAVVLLLQAADSFYAMQHWAVFKKWNERKFSEAMDAFKGGRAKKDPSTDWYELELDFLENHIIPLCASMKKLGVFGTSADECFAFASTNRDQWKANGPMLVKSMLDNYSGKKDKTRSVSQRTSLSAV